MQKCACDSGKDYKVCCEPYHSGQKPENALLLMRSRYAAYKMHNPDYIIQTTHPENPKKEKSDALWKKRVREFSEMTNFEKLEVLDFSDGVEKAHVTFTAHMVQNGSDVTFTEKSEFLKEEGVWLYFDGEIKWGKSSKSDFD